MGGDRDIKFARQFDHSQS